MDSDAVVDWGPLAGDLWHVPTPLEHLQALGVVGYERTTELDDEVIAHFPDNKRSIDHYINNMLHTTRGDFLVAPCGVGKTKFAPGRLAAKRGARTIYMLTERILSTISAYDWYLQHPLDGVRKITMRAGGKSRVHEFESGDVEMFMMTTGAFVANKPSLLGDIMVLLDEAHNPTSETLWVNRNVPSHMLVQTTASPLLDGVPADFSTPLARKVSFREVVGVADFISNMENRVDSGLCILPTVRAVDDACVLLASMGLRVIFATSEHKGLFTMQGGIPKRTALTFEQIAKAVAERKTYVVATDVLQESVTLKISLVVDLGLRIRPRKFLAQDYSDLSVFDDESLIMRYLRQNVQKPAHRFEILQSAGRVGRVPVTDPPLAIIGNLSAIRTGTHDLFSYNPSIAIGGKLNTRTARENYRKVVQFAKQKKCFKLLDELKDHLKLECKDWAYTREDFERVVAQSMPRLLETYVPSVPLNESVVESLAALALGNDSDEESVIIITEQTVAPAVGDTEAPSKKGDAESHEVLAAQALDNDDKKTNKRRRGNRAGAAKKHLRRGYCAMKLYDNKQRRELPFKRWMTLESLMDLPEPKLAHTKRLVFKDTLRCHVAERSKEVHFLKQLMWIKQHHFKKIRIGGDAEELDISYEEFEMYVNATTPEEVPRKVGAGGECWLKIGVCITDLALETDDLSAIDATTLGEHLLFKSAMGETPTLFRSLDVISSEQEDGDLHIDDVVFAEYDMKKIDGKYQRVFKYKGRSLADFAVFLVDNGTKLVGRKDEPRDDAGALDEGINAISVGMAKEAIESRIGNATLDEFDRVKDACPYHIDRDLRRFMKMAGLPYTATAAIEHTHAVHAAIRRHKYKEVYPKYIDQDVTIYQIKRAHADMIRTDHQIEIKNAIIDANDMGRWDVPSVSEFVFKHEQPSNSLVIFDEWGHYCTPASIVNFMANDRVTTLLVSHETPLLALYSARSPVPELWQHKRVGDTLVVQIEKEGRPYYQPFDFTLLLSRKIVCPELGMVLYCAVVWQSHNCYVQQITKYRVEVPALLSVETYGFMPLPILFRDQYDTDMVPRRLWNEVLQYARAMPKVTMRDLQAKLRQSIDPRYEQMDHNTTCVMLACIKAIVECDVYSDSETKFYDTLAGKIYYNIPGRIKKWFKSKTTKAWHRRWIGISSPEHPLMTVPLAVVHVRGIPKNAIGQIYKKSNPKLKITDMNLSGDDDVFGTFWEVDPETQPELTDLLMRWHRKLFYAKKDTAQIVRSIMEAKAGIFFSEEHFPSTYGRTQSKELLAQQAYRWRRERGQIAMEADSESWEELGKDEPPHVPNEADDASTLIGSGFDSNFRVKRKNALLTERSEFGSEYKSSLTTLYESEEEKDDFSSGIGSVNIPQPDVFGENEGRVLPHESSDDEEGTKASFVANGVVHDVRTVLQGDDVTEVISIRSPAVESEADEGLSARREHLRRVREGLGFVDVSDLVTEAEKLAQQVRERAEKQENERREKTKRIEEEAAARRREKGKQKAAPLVEETPGAGPSSRPIPNEKLYEPTPMVPSIRAPELTLEDKLHDALLHPVDVIPREQTPSIKSMRSSVRNNRAQFDKVAEGKKVTFTRVSRGLTHKAWWDDQFPTSIARRYSSTPYWPVQPGQYNYPQNDCMLEVIQDLLAGLRKQKVSKVVIWGVACTIMPKNEIDTYNYKMSSNFLDGLCVAYRLNVKVKSSVNRPYHVGVNTGMELLVGVDGGHWTAEKVHRPIVVRTMFTQGGYSASLVKQLVQALTNMQQIMWVDYVPDTARAEAYIREAIVGNIGTTRSEVMNEGKLKALELSVVNRKPHTIQLAVIRGDPGCGKSKPLLDLLRQKQYHRHDAFQWIVPNSNLKKDAGEKLGVRPNKPGERGTPRQYCCTFEVAQWETTGGAVVFGDEGKFAPGYWDFMLLNKPHIKFLVLLFDEHQGSWHQSTPATLLTTMTTNNEWFAPYSNQFIIGTARFGSDLGNILCTPVCREFKHGGLYFSEYALTQWEELRKIWPDATDEELKGYWTDSVTLEATNAAVMGAEIMNETDNVTMSGSQGLTKSLVRLNVSKTALSRVDASVLWNAMSRAPRLIINFEYSQDNRALHYERVSPIWSEIIWYRQNTKPLEKAKFHPDHTIDFRRIQNKLPKQTKLYLAFPKEKCLNWAEVQHAIPRLDGFLDPFGKPKDSGGREYFKQLDPADEGHALDPQIGAFRSGLKVEVPTSVPMQEPVLAPIKVKTATPPESLPSHIEGFVSQQSGRYTRELFNARHGWSEQFPDEPIVVLNKDQIIKKKAAAMFGATDKKTLRFVEKMLRDMNREDSELYVNPYILNRANRQTSRDAASFSAGISQRVRKGTERDNALELVRGEPYANELFKQFKRFMLLDKELPWDPIAWERAGAKFEERRADRSTALKKASSNRSEPDFHMITAKTQIKLKSREPNKEAKPLQIIEVFNNKYVYKWGPVGVYMLEKLQAVCPEGVFMLAGKTFEDLRAQNARYETGENWMSDLVAQEKDMRGWYFSFFAKVMRHFGFNADTTAEFISDHSNLKIGDSTILFQTLSGMIFTWLMNTMGNMARIATHYDVRPGEPSEWTGDDAKFHRVLRRRPGSEKWLLIETAEEKIITGNTGEFAMYLNRRGVTFKDPIILLDKLLVKLARGEAANVIHGYFYEWLTIYQLGDLMYDVMDEEEMASAKVLTRVMMNLRREFGVNVTLNWEHVPPWDPLNHLHAGVVLSESAELEYILETKSFKKQEHDVEAEVDQ